MAFSFNLFCKSISQAQIAAPNNNNNNTDATTTTTTNYNNYYDFVKNFILKYNFRYLTSVV